MNFFKKLTGSIKVSGADFLDQEKPPANNTDFLGLGFPNQPKNQLTKTDQEQPPQTKTEILEAMFGTGAGAGQEEPEKNREDEEAPEGDGDGDGDSEESLPEQKKLEEGEEEGTFTTASLAKAKTLHQNPVKTLKKSLSRLSIGQAREPEEEAVGKNSPEGQLAIDVYETPDEVVIKSTIAGVKPENLDIGIEDNTVNIRGSRHNDEKVKGEDYFYQECYWGTFSRSVILPVEVDTDKTTAALKDGILTVRLPKIKKEKEKKIKVLF